MFEIKGRYRNHISDNTCKLVLYISTMCINNILANIMKGRTFVMYVLELLFRCFPIRN